MKDSTDKILLDRLIYLQIILVVPLMIFLLPLILFPESMPEYYWEIFTSISPYLYNDAGTSFLKPALGLLENPIFIFSSFILWITCYALLLTSKKTGVQLFYILIGIDIFYVIYGGDQIYTPLLGLVEYIAVIAQGMTLYLVTFSSIKNSFK